VGDDLRLHVLESVREEISHVSSEVGCVGHIWVGNGSGVEQWCLDLTSFGKRNKSSKEDRLILEAWSSVSYDVQE
jgi:hypothetical protein